jgi:hypothetical protein
MKKIIAVLIQGFFIICATAQNIGIGIDPPTRARLETRGVVGNTLALFGQDFNGISLVANIPGIYFNSYYNSGPRSIQSGQGGNLSFDPAIGNFQFYRNAAATGPDQFVAQTLIFSIEANGNLIANAYRFNTPKTYYYSVAAADFNARDGSDVVTKEFGTGGASMNNGDGFNGMVAPVHLPHGSTVTAVTFYFTDNSATTDLDMAMLKYFPNSSTYQIMASFTSSGVTGPSNGTDISILAPLTDNSNSTCLIRVITNPTTWPNTLLIRSVVIAYTLAEAQ